MAKYNTEEERLEARKASARRFYEKNKDNPEYRARKTEASKKFYQNNREVVNEKAVEYYHSNKEYRERKLQQTKERLQKDPNYKKVQNEQNKERYWRNKALMLEYEKMLMDNGVIEVKFQ